MPFNGAGVFAIVNTFVPGTTIFSSAVNANFTDIATGLSTAVLKNGTQTITADIPMGGFGFTGVGKLSSQAVITVASSSTTDILSQLSLLIAISGTATITSLGTGANTIKYVRATGAFTLTHNGTTLILPGAANIVAASGDTFVVISDGSSNARVYAYQRASAYPIIGNPGFVNTARRNGGMEVWQRGAGGAASIAVAASVTTGQYTADGWYLGTAANEASVVSQQAGITDGSQWCARVQRNSGQTGTGEILFGFPLDTDELYAMLGKFVRLSLTLKAGANWSPASGNMTVQVIVGTGTPVRGITGYTGLTTPVATTVPITGTATRFQASSSVVIPTTTRQAEILLRWTPVGTAGAADYFEVDDVQLEIVPDASQGASPFERLNFAEQLSQCKRHFQKTFAYATAPAQSTSASSCLQWVAISTTQPSFYDWLLPVNLRIASGATVTLYNPSAANAQIRNSTDAADFSSSVGGQNNENHVTPSGVVNAGMGANDLIIVNVTVDAGI